jgi:hypothetical protein
MNDGNATPLEIAYAAVMGLAFLVSLASLSTVAWKYSIYRRPDEEGHRPNGISVWLFARDALLYGMLVILTISETMFGLFAMTVPSSQAQTDEPVLGFLTIGMAILIMLLAATNLVIGIAAFRRLGGKE